jgi:hypothetical protein
VGGIEADVTAVDRDGRVVVRGEGVRMRHAARWPGDATDG